MIVSALTCNSLRLRDFGAAILRRLVTWGDGGAEDGFRSELVRFFSVPADRIFLFGAGRMGLYSFLQSLGLEPNSEVAVTGYTCVVVTNAIQYLGFKPLYLDIDPKTTNLDTERALLKITERTRVLIAAHNYGIPYLDIDRIRSRFPRLIIIEDAAHSLSFPDPQGRQPGRMGDAAFFSLEHHKPITSGVGGILIVNNPDLLARVDSIYQRVPTPPLKYLALPMASLAFHLLTSYRATAFIKQAAMNLLKAHTRIRASYEQELAGKRPSHYPVRMSPLQAELARRQLSRIGVINASKLEISRRYREMLSQIPRLVLYGSDSMVFVRYPLGFEDSVPAAVIARIRTRLRDEVGIAVGDWFSDLIHPKGSLRYQYVPGLCPNGEMLAGRVLNLPVSIHLRLRDSELESMRDILADELGPVPRRKPEEPA